jgi:Phosphoribosyl-ATP pyrophosphohydrolase
MTEELNEFIEGVEECDLAKMFDSLIDLVYVAHGTAHLFGFPWEVGWKMVQDANMTKVRAERADQSERGGTWDVIKPPDFQPPDIKGLLHRLAFPNKSGINRCSVCENGIFDNSECYTINPTPGHKQFAHTSCAEREGLL